MAVPTDKRSRRCASLTLRGTPCRSAPLRGGAFCLTHWRLGVGVACWGGPLDGCSLRSPDARAPLARWVWAAKNEAGDVDYRDAERHPHPSDTILGHYIVVPGGEYPWYRWSERWRSSPPRASHSAQRKAP